ncbi:MAG: NHL repeat-containing protein [Planctomycetes bacterium]|nr:NHL repeat-containing protein [Planctomycetota bacterium]
MRFPATALALATLAASVAAGEFPAHRLFVCSQGTDSVLAFDPSGKQVAEVGADSQLSVPSGAAFGPDGRLYVASWGTGRVLVFDGSGVLQATLGADADLVMPRGVAFGPDGRLYVGDGGAGLVRILSPDDGAALGTVGAPGDLANPLDLAFGRDGHLFVACGAGDSVAEYDASGDFVREVGADSELAGAGGLALGSDGLLYVASSVGDSVLVFDAGGELVDELGLGALDAPCGLAFDPEGHLCVLSRGDDLVVVLDVQHDDVLDTFGGDLDTGFGLVWSPVRFPVKLRGTLVVAADSIGSQKQTGVLSVTPSGPLMLALDDDPSTSDELVDVLGHTWFVLPAQLTLGPDGDKQRDYLGAWTSQDPAAPGLLSLSVGVSGKYEKKSGFFVPKRAKGTLIFGDPSALFLGKVATSKPLN